MSLTEVVAHHFRRRYIYDVKAVSPMIPMRIQFHFYLIPDKNQISLKPAKLSSLSVLTSPQFPSSVYKYQLFSLFHVLVASFSASSSLHSTFPCQQDQRVVENILPINIYLYRSIYTIL